MDNVNNKDHNGKEDQLRVEFLDRFDLYQTMSVVFFNKLSAEDKIQGLLEVIELTKEKNNE